MNDNIIYDDFTGFTFNGIHSSQLNLYRVSDGNRYQESIIPTFQDKTSQVEGRDGALYWNSFYSQKEFRLSMAFDSVTEDNLREIRNLFNGKISGRLSFDELPYKYYLVKIQTTPQIKYICFMEDNQRIYKGELEIQFVCYYPYAKNEIQYLDQASGPRYANLNEWALSSKILQNNKKQGSVYYNSYITYVGSNGCFHLYNSGDIDTYFKLILPINATTTDSRGITLKLHNDGETTQFSLNSLSKLKTMINIFVSIVKLN